MKAMTYEKPEITVIGDAADALLGSIPKQMAPMEPPGGGNEYPLDCEFDD